MLQWVGVNFGLGAIVAAILGALLTLDLDGCQPVTAIAGL